MVGSGTRGCYVNSFRRESKVNALTRYSDYATKLQDHCNLAIRCVIEVEETKQIIHLSKAFRLKKPEMVITAPANAKLGVVLSISVSFKNPLPTQLTKCVLNVDGSGLTPYTSIPQKNVGVGAMFEGSISIKPWTKGKHLAAFSPVNRLQESSVNIRSR